MKIEAIHISTIEFTLANPYTIAYESISKATNHFLRLTLKTGHEGLGCSAPAPEVTGESLADAKWALDRIAERIRGAHVEDIRDFMAVVRADFPDTPSACASLDMALFDAYSRSTGAPLSDLLHASPSARSIFPTSITIGISSLDETLRQAHQCVQKGFRFLKVKGGHDVETDIQRLVAVRNDFGSDVRLSLDANQGYAPKDVEKLDRENGHINLEYLEQPVPAKRLDLLAQARTCTSIPVMADEAVCTVSHLQAVIDAQAADLVNIKLQKVGGLCVAEQLDDLAREAGMASMLGCMDESALSISAALAFASARPDVRYCDLDGHLDLTDDPFSNLVKTERGCLSINTGPDSNRARFPDVDLRGNPASRQ